MRPALLLDDLESRGAEDDDEEARERSSAMGTVGWYVVRPLVVTRSV